VSFVTIIHGVKAWLKKNALLFELESIEINPVVFKIVNESIQKEILSRTIGDTEIRLIDGIPFRRSEDPLSGIHFKFKDKPEIPTEEYL